MKVKKVSLPRSKIQCLFIFLILNKQFFYLNIVGRLSFQTKRVVSAFQDPISTCFLNHILRKLNDREFLNLLKQLSLLSEVFDSEKKTISKHIFSVSQLPSNSIQLALFTELEIFLVSVHHRSSTPFFPHLYHKEGSILLSNVKQSTAINVTTSLLLTCP